MSRDLPAPPHLRDKSLEGGLPEILAELRLGHEVPGMCGLYSHVSQRMREDLKQALQACWGATQRACGTLAPPFFWCPPSCDLTLCAPDVVFGDGNFRAGAVGGDGMYLALREMVGVKRANQVVYTRHGIAAGEAERLGIINEVLPREDLLP